MSYVFIERSRAGLRGVCAALAAVGALVACPLSVHAEIVSFAGVVNASVPVDQYESGNIAFSASQKLSTSALASAGNSTSTAAARTTYGVNRVSVANSVAVDNEQLRDISIGGPAAFAISAWADRFQITGGTGTGQARLSGAVTGQFGAGYGSSGLYLVAVVSDSEVQALVNSPVAFFLANYESLAQRSVLFLEQNVIDPRFADPGEALPPASRFGGLVFGSLPFEYGQQFWLMGLVAAFANDFGSLDALNSAFFGISAQPGDSIASLSDTSYDAALTAVPLPAPALLLGGGLLVLALAGRRTGVSRVLESR